MSEDETVGVDEAHPEAGWSDPVSLVAGDRLCAGCGFNLTGQPIAREPRYELLVVRCPRCGQVTPMEAHPAHGAWIARWSMLGAALWLVLLIGMALGGAGFTVGFTFAATIEASEWYDRGAFAMRTVLWREQNQEEVSDDSFARFWSSSRSEFPPGLEFIEWDELALLLFPMGCAIVSGAFWSLALLSWSRRRLLVVGIGVVVAINLLAGAVWLFLASLPVFASEQVAWVRLWMPLALVSGLLIAAAFLLALLLARSIVRGLVGALVPPGLRGALAFLWTVEGLAPPEPPPGAHRPRREVAR